MTQSALSSVLLVLTFPDLNPVAIAIGPIQVRWYGLAYMAGLVFGWYYIRKLVGAPQRWGNASPPFQPTAVDDLLLYMTIGVIVGGRLGQVLLYEPGAYYRDPLEIFRLWHGGMAFHGALLASGFAIYIFAKHTTRASCRRWTCALRQCRVVSSWGGSQISSTATSGGARPMFRGRCFFRQLLATSRISSQLAGIPANCTRPGLKASFYLECCDI